MPSPKSLLLTTALAATTTAQTFGNYSTISNVSSSACPASGNTAHIIIARASLEPLGYGIIGAVKDHVLSALPGSNAEYVNYPATLTDYFDSEQAGVLGMKKLVEEYMAKNCSAPLVLMGYSQGAQVTADFLSGQNVNGFPFNSTLTAPASQDVLKRVAAVAIMGDPSINITDSSYHVGNSTKSGLYTRLANSSAVLEGISGKVRSYCDEGDPYCANAGNFDQLYVHLQYVEEYGKNATDFVVGKVGEWYANQTAGTPTGSADEPAYTGGAAERRVGWGIAAAVGLVGVGVLGGW